MNAGRMWRSALVWMAARRAFLAEGRRLRRDAEAVSRMDSRELLDVGLSRSAAARGEVLRDSREQGRSSNWIHAQPRFVSRETVRRRPSFDHGHAL